MPATPEVYAVRVSHPWLERDAEIDGLLHAAGFNQAQAQFVYGLAAERVVPVIAGTAAGRGAVPALQVPTGPRDPLAAPLPAPARDDASVSAASSAAPHEPAAPGASSPLEHPDAQAGLALTAADSLLRKGIDLAVSLAGGDPAVARKLVELGANALAGVLPEPYRASAKSSADAAAAEAERRVGDNERSTRTRAALGTLANRRAEVEQEHAAAVIAGERAKIADARRDAIEAWAAERRARGDGEAEIDAAARAMAAQYRRAALRHRLAQLTDAEQDRVLAADDDAKADPAGARRLLDDIRRLRRDDPARAGEASIEREIVARKRDGRIDTPEEETAARYKLRLDAQAQRGIPTGERRLLTYDERTKLATEYHRIESAQGKVAADAWLDERARLSGTLSARLKTEVSTLPAPTTEALSAPPLGNETDYTEPGRVETAQDRGNRASGQNNSNANSSVRSETFGQETQRDLRQLYPVGKIPREALIRTVTDAAIRRGELPSNTSIYLWGSLAADGPEIVRIAAAHSIVRMAREAPELARRAFEPWQIGAAQRVVDLERQLSEGLSPDASAHPAAQREALRRAHLETGAIFAPGWFAANRRPQFVAKPWRAAILEQNGINGKFSEKRVSNWLRSELKDYRVTIQSQKLEQTPIGRVRPDDRILNDLTRRRIASVETKDGNAKLKRPQRERLAALGNVHIARYYRDRGVIEVDGRPGPIFIADFKQMLDQLGLRRN